jgi:dipeptidyl aminopeptidase/acylaminoacyl peptidase
VPDETFDLDRFLALPRLSGLRGSHDGSQLAVSVTTPAPDAKSMRSAWWAVDPTGGQPPRRLTRSLPGEGGSAFGRDGAFLFVSKRADPDSAETGDDRERARLWRLDPRGGEARLIASMLGGIDEPRAARSADRLVFASEVFPGADLAGDERQHKARSDAGVKAMLFDGYPIRRWDHYLGPRERHLFVLDLPGPESAVPTAPISTNEEDGAPAANGPAANEPAANEPAANGQAARPRDITPGAGHALIEQAFDISADGRRVVVSWARNDDLTHLVTDLVLIDAETGERRTLVAGADHDGHLGEPAFSPDGRWIAAVHRERSTPQRLGEVTLWLVDPETGATRDLLPGFDLWPHAPSWSTDGRALIFTADRLGSVAIFRLELGSDGSPGAPLLLADDGEHTCLTPTPDGSLFAMRATPAEPPHPTRYDTTSPDQQPARLPTFPDLDELTTPGIVERISTRAADGVEVHSWLIRPRDDADGGRSPLLVWVHGGPVGSWTGWHWRWNPHLLAARGYAVLAPDPAISTGYGYDFIARGHGRWGDTPYTDVIAALDGALADRSDLDPERTALMGGSFGGYMANWVAGQTDRFRAIVTHASLWELHGFHGTTDFGPDWEEEFGDPYTDPSRYDRANPRPHVSKIRTPMLVIHGELDHRVPIGEALRLWTDLQRHGVEGRFLYFPDENHWILKPQNARLWYETVIAFLDERVLGHEWRRPALL